MTRASSQARPIVLALVGAILLALAGWVIYINIEFYEETEESSWSIRALTNPYLAAQQFLEHSEIGVTEVDNLARLDEMSSLGTLFFSDSGQVQTPRELDRLIDWLRAGGNVIYSANSVTDGEDLLLDRLQVEVDWHYADEDDDGADEEKSFSETLREYNRQLEEGKSREEIIEQANDEDVSLTTIAFGGDIGDLDIAFDTSLVLHHVYIDDADSDSSAYQPFSWSNSEYGIHMMQFEIGDGLLTIVTDPGIWTSYRIDRHDHAYLLWLLASGDGNFAVLRAVLRDSIWELMRRHAAELLLASLLLVLFWIWRRGRRFGRVVPREAARRRALGEHFSSVSHYLWHRREGVYLISPLRQEVLRRASLALSGFASAEVSRQFELLAERADINPDAVARAFERDQFNEASFVQTVRLLKRIEQSL